MTGPNRLLVFSDLDGTLLDHDTYGFENARPALRLLKERGHRLVLASSKTAAEMAPIREATGFEHCEAIIENGAGILPPLKMELFASSGGTEHDRLCRALAALPAGLRACFTGFSDWSVEEVARRTGLSQDAAALAKKRMFSEPGIWRGSESDFEDFRAILGKDSIFVQQGGRFSTLSFGGTKGARLADLAEHYRRVDGASSLTVALGDAPNDRDMLARADIAIVIPNPAHAGLAGFTRPEGKQLRWAQKTGAAGWNEEVLRLLDEIEKREDRSHV